MSTITIGGFDGVHIAHQKLIKKADIVLVIEKGSSLTPGFERLFYINKKTDFLILEEIKHLKAIEFINILKKYNAKATIYLVVDRHNREWSSKKKAHRNSGELKNESKLKDEQIKEMLKSGLIEIGSHTITHPNLLKLDYNSSKEEIEKSKEILEKTFNIECVSFCYPFGLFKNEDVDIIKNAGYLSATTTNKGISDIKKEDLFLLKRIAISGKDNKLDFILKIRSAKRGIK